MQLVYRWAIATGALFVTVWILQQLGLAEVQSRSVLAWAVAAVVMGLVNTVLRPIANILTAPLNCLTFGLLGVFINGAMFALVPVFSAMGGQSVFRVTLLGAVVGGLLVGLISGAANKMLRATHERE